ncbi:hypothetical protein SNE40_001078 [Patella caerulea]|uniref:SH3 domain-containing protein n=1 Tax=Patella caerulea TaxID=87958 RepID=A0AAN8K6F5_PATCE
MYLAIYDYETQNIGDIALTKGDQIDRVKDVGCGWMIGHNITTNMTGHFPAAYIQPSSEWKRRLTSITSRKKNTPKNETTAQLTKRNIPVNLNEKNTLEPIKDPMLKSPEKDNLKGRSDTKLDKDKLHPLEIFRKKFTPQDKIKRRRLKVALGFGTGLLLGTVLFFALFYSFHYTLLVSGIITGISTLLLCVGLAFSSRCRCIILLVLPSLATGKGRVAFLSLITGFLLMGPVMNITQNANEVAASMACITELAYNQSQVLQDALKKPLEEVEEQVKEGVDFVKDYASRLNREFTKARNAFSSAESTVTDAINGFERKCVSSVNSGLNECLRGSEKLKQDCHRSLDPIKMATNEIDKVINSVKDFFQGRRRRDVFSTHGYLGLNRTKRQSGGIGRVCDIFFAGDQICSALKTINVCSIVSFPKDVFSGAFGIFNGIFNAYAKLLEVDFESSGNIDSEANASQSAAQIISNIRSELKSKIDIATYYIDILNRVVSLSVILLIINAFLYERKYLSKISFDNLYITSYFKTIDRQRKDNGKISILPLKKKERKIYTESRSLKMSSIELTRCKTGLAQVLLHAVMCVMLVLFDYLLYYILDLLNRHGDVQFVFTGQSKLNIRIIGDGLVALLFRTLTGDIRVSQTYNSVVDINTCLPKPKDPNFSSLYVYGVLYMAALLLVLLQGYGLRLMHFIAAFFYPEKEHQRVNYLYRKILVKRKVFLKEAKQMILSNAVGSSFDDGHSLCGGIATRFPCRKSRKTCTNCEVSSEDISTCGNEKCGAFYCEECFVEFGKSCPLCTNDEDDEDVYEVFSLREETTMAVKSPDLP